MNFPRSGHKKQSVLSTRVLGIPVWAVLLLLAAGTCLVLYSTGALTPREASEHLPSSRSY